MATSPLPSRGPHGGEINVATSLLPSRGPHGGEKSTEANLLHGVCTACSAHTMKPSQGGREETTLHLCKHHKGLHILGGWWPWPRTICCCVSVLEDGGSLPEIEAFCIDPIGAQLIAICSTMWAVVDKPCY